MLTLNSRGGCAPWRWYWITPQWTPDNLGVRHGNMAGLLTLHGFITFSCVNSTARYRCIRHYRLRDSSQACSLMKVSLSLRRPGNRSSLGFFWDMWIFFLVLWPPVSQSQSRSHRWHWHPRRIDLLCLICIKSKTGVTRPRLLDHSCLMLQPKERRAPPLSPHYHVVCSARFNRNIWWRGSCDL